MKSILFEHWRSLNEKTDVDIIETSAKVILNYVKVWKDELKKRREDKPNKVVDVEKAIKKEVEKICKLVKDY